jgi:hypothetical protein
MQMSLLERQQMNRLMTARQEQDNVARSFENRPNTAAGRIQNTRLGPVREDELRSTLNATPADRQKQTYVTSWSQY